MGNTPVPPPPPKRTCTNDELPALLYRPVHAEPTLPLVKGFPAFYDNETQKVDPIKNNKWVVSLRGDNEATFRAYYAGFCETYAGHVEGYGQPATDGYGTWSIEMSLCTDLYMNLFPDGYEHWVKKMGTK